MIDKEEKIKIIETIYDLFKDHKILNLNCQNHIREVQSQDDAYKSYESIGVTITIELRK